MKPRARFACVLLERVTTLFSRHNFSQSPEDVPVILDENIGAVRGSATRHPEGADSDAVRRFEREATVMGRLDSPNVVRVFEVGDASSAQPYIAMERLYGSNLGAILRKRRTLPTAEVVDLVRQVANALEAARALDVVHRDLKPQNLFWAEDAKVWKVLDFGISKLGDSAGTLTQGQPIGTPGYMAPEQALGKAVDHRADVFALAAIAYRALTGSPAFAAEDPAATLFNVLYRQPARPGELVAMPSDVELVVAVGLAKSSSGRFLLASELAAALGDAVDGCLPPPVRARGLALLAAHPWGSDAMAERDPTRPARRL